jgi:large subunit ribosomal protein L25
MSLNERKESGMERPSLRAEYREGIGKGAARKLRQKGMIPAAFYGPQAKPMALTVNPKELVKSLQTDAGGNVLINLHIRKGEQIDQKVVMVKEVQVDPLKDVPIHVDFYEIAMDTRITIEVPIRLVGRPEGVKVGGILEQVRRTVRIECFPEDIPKSIDVDVSGLQIGDSIHGGDLRVEKAKILLDAGATIATVVPPAAEEKKPEEVAPEAGAEAKEEAAESKEEER